MTSILGMAIAAGVQLGLFLAIPVIVWAVSARKSTEFGPWIGLIAPTWSATPGQVATAVAGYAALAGAAFVLVATVGDHVAAGNFRGEGWAALIPLLIHAFLQTSLSEELLFRGFIGKRLCARFGFGVGNAVQAVLFGALHVALLAVALPWMPLLGVGLLTAATGWLVGWITQELAGGSILPAWGLHGLANLATGLVFAFGLL